MTLAYDYPLLGVFWSVLWFFILIVWIMALFHVFVDIFRSHDMGGFAKALWLIFVVFMPFLGVFVYLIARGNKMAEHAAAEAQKRNEANAAYVRTRRDQRSRRPAHADSPRYTIRRHHAEPSSQPGRPRSSASPDRNMH